MGSGLTKKKSIPSQEHSQTSMSQELRPSDSIDKSKTEKTETIRRKLQQSSDSSPSTTEDSTTGQDEDTSYLTQGAKELQFVEPQSEDNARLDSKKTNSNKPHVIKGTSRSDTQVLSSPRREIPGHLSWQDLSLNVPFHLTQPASFSALTPGLYKRRPQYEFADFNKGKLLGEQKWGEACTESLRSALFPNQDSNKNTQLPRSLPGSIEKMEPLRTTNLSPVKSKDSSRTDRRNSILSNLNCTLDVIPENVDDENDDPDDYEYSEMNLYF